MVFLTCMEEKEDISVGLCRSRGPGRLSVLGNWQEKSGLGSGFRVVSEQVNLATAEADGTCIWKAGL